MAEGNTGAMAVIEEIDEKIDTMHVIVKRAAKLTRKAMILLMCPERSEADIDEAMRLCREASEALGSDE